MTKEKSTNLQENYNIRETDDFSTQCKYCNEIFMIEDDLAQHESSAHGDNLEDYNLINGEFQLKTVDFNSSGGKKKMTKIKKGKEKRERYSVRQEPSVMKAIVEIYGSFTEFIDDSVIADKQLMKRIKVIKTEIICKLCNSKFDLTSNKGCPHCVL